MIIINNKDEFYDFLNNNDNVIVDFFATWCGPCKMLMPQLEKIVTDCPNLKIIKVDVDQCENLAVDHEISSLPTLVFFKKGKKIFVHVGYINSDGIKQLAKENFNF